MAIRPHGNGYQIDVTVKGQRAPRITLPTKAEAQAAEATVRANMLAGRDPLEGLSRGTVVTSVSTGPTISHALEWAARTRWRGTKSEAGSLAKAHGIVLDLGADYPLSDITLPVVHQLVDKWHAAGNEPSTINRKLAGLSVMLKAARERGLPIPEFRMPRQKEYEGRLRWFTEEEERSLLEFTFGHQTPAYWLMIVAVETGARYGELMALRVRDLSLDGPRPTVTFWDTKGGKPRTIPLTMRAQNNLGKATFGLGLDDRVFPEVLTNGYLSRLIARWKRQQGLPEDDEACFHTFRHTCCSRLVQRGVPIVVVKEWMGHSTIATTMRYAHLAPSSLDVALTALER